MSLRPGSQLIDISPSDSNYYNQLHRPGYTRDLRTAEVVTAMAGGFFLFWLMEKPKKIWKHTESRAAGSQPTLLEPLPESLVLPHIRTSIFI